MAIAPDRKKRLHVRGRELNSKQLTRWSVLGTLGIALGCGIVGIITTTAWFEAAVLLAISTGLAYIVVATRESTEAMAETHTCTRRRFPACELRFGYSAW